MLKRVVSRLHCRDQRRAFLFSVTIPTRHRHSLLKDSHEPSQPSFPVPISSVCALKHALIEPAAFSQSSRSTEWWHLLKVLGATACAVIASTGSIGVPALTESSSCQVEVKSSSIEHESNAELVNWSGTHKACPSRLYTPASLKELETLVAEAHRTGQKLRPVGTYLSPNGIASASQNELMVTLTNMDQILSLDKENLQVTVEAGIVVDRLLSELGKYGLTLANFSSIKEQQMGGWTQVAAHGTGATLPTVDEMIVNMKLVTPANGTIELSQDSHPELFRLARVGLGALGVVSEMTLKCVPVHKLREETYVLRGDAAVRERHDTLLKDFKHLRYMWIPGSDVCTVVQSNPTDQNVTKPSTSKPSSGVNPTKPLENLLKEVRGQDGHGKSFAELRDLLLAHDPLSSDHVARINAAEGEFWSNNSGTRVDWSENILGFECGGSQWVFEMCFPTGTLEKPTHADLDFVRELRDALKAANLPAPAPIEQRWTASSSSPMSPAYSPNKDDIFSWVGGIMYMPTDESRQAVTRRFLDYRSIMNHIAARYGAHAHWAKIELPNSEAEDYGAQLSVMRQRIRDRYPVKKFNAWRHYLDPKGVMSNELISSLFDEIPPRR